MVAETAERELVDGATAIVRGALDAGCTFFAGYPITPASSILAAMMRELPKAGAVAIQGVEPARRRSSDQLCELVDREPCLPQNRAQRPGSKFPMKRNYRCSALFVSQLDVASALADLQEAASAKGPNRVRS